MATKYPSADGYVESSRKDWNPDGGEAVETTYRGAGTEVSALYESAKSDADVVNAQLSIERGRGEATIRKARLVSGETSAPGETQELYACDIVKSIYAHPYFETLSNAELVAVRDSFEASTGEDGAWSDLQKSLYFHLAHGVQDYYETGFIFRSTRRVSKNEALDISCDNINEVVNAPTASGAMAELLSALPSGEWLKRPPSIRYVRPGVWEASEEWQWANKWSVIYGGSFGGTTTT